MWPLAVVGAGAIAFWLYLVRDLGAPKVFERQRAAGIHPDLQKALDEWSKYGPFPIMVGDNGGLRNDATQLMLYMRGVTNAITASTSAHGRGAAVDLWPVVDGQPTFNNTALYQQMGKWFKDRGFIWGGDWKSPVDMPHIEIPNWTSLPYPANYATV